MSCAVHRLDISGVWRIMHSNQAVRRNLAMHSDVLAGSTVVPFRHV